MDEDEVSQNTLICALIVVPAGVRVTFLFDLEREQTPQGVCFFIGPVTILD